MVKFRENYYNLIENQPKKVKQIKSKMIVHNIYALRMNIDLGFKQFMMKLLYQSFQEKINEKSLKRLLISILDELERPAEMFFNIFNNNSSVKFEFDIEIINRHSFSFKKSKLFSIKIY